MMATRLVLAFIITGLFSFSKQYGASENDPKKTTAFEDAPGWARDVIWYEIGVERFRNGDPNNDPTVEDIQGAYPGFVPDGWNVTPWTQDWYKHDPYFSNLIGEKNSSGYEMSQFVDVVHSRRYGGDLQGVLDKIDYLDSLGITAVYFRPIFDSPSLHKYDARNWTHVDVNFGPDPVKDKQTIAAEVPDDPSTWQMTEADKLFLHVLDEFHERGIKVIVDYSFNHTGNTFWAWEDLVENQTKSKYKDWYWVEEFDDPSTNENEFKYHGWWGVPDLPEVRETSKQDVTVLSTFEGNIYSEEAKQHIFDVTQRWLDPDGDGDPSDGVDGYRLDVAAETPMGFWRDFRKHVRSINPDAFLMGEIWWEEWPDKLLDPEPYLRGDVFDAVMNYRWFRAARHYFNESPNEISSKELVDSLNRFQSNIRTGNNYSMMNYTCGFDTPRLLTSLFNKNKYKYKCKVHEDPQYKIHKPDSATYETLRLLLTQQFTYIGSPHIYAGDEMGMWGADDPSSRKPLIWKDYDFEDEVAHPLGHDRPVDKVAFDEGLFDFYQEVIALRKSNPVLMYGDIEYTLIDDVNKLLAYRRFDETDEVIAIFNSSKEARRVELDTKTVGKMKDYFGNATVKKDGNKINLFLPPRSSAVLVRI